MMRWLIVLLIATAVALSGPASVQAQTSSSGKKASATSQQKKAKKPATRRTQPRKNNFTGAVLNCKPPMTYEDYSRCGYGL